MRIALVHSFYRSESPSGENSVVRSQQAALEAAGHEVALVARYTDDERQGPAFALRSAATVVTGRGPDPTRELRAFTPDVVHVHNLFPNFGDSWLTRWVGPVVATLHNYRPLCANALLFRDGGVCTQCLPPSTSWSAVRHGCYHGSRVGSIPLAIRNSRGPDRNRLLARADRVIVLSSRSQRIYSSAAGPVLARKMTVIHNGLADRGHAPAPPRRHWTFVGRLSEEKGVAELLAAWPDGEPLVVVGDGPLRRQVRASAPASVRFVGTLDSAGVDEALRASWGLLLPSRCYEGFPTVVAEALMHGTPVVALTGNAGADFVADRAVGAVYAGADDLAGALQQVRDDTELPARCRRAYQDQLTVGAWVAHLMACYESVGAARF